MVGPVVLPEGSSEAAAALIPRVKCIGSQQASRMRRWPSFISEGLFDGRGQRVVISVEDEDSEQLCRLCLARVAADRMDRARRFGPALTRPIDARLAVIHFRLDRARDHI